MHRLRAFSFFMVIYTILVIDWGAWVRISKAGDGCGDHWPLCHGQVVPVGAGLQTWVEFSHRVSTGIFGIFILIIFFSARRMFLQKSPQRKYSSIVLILTLVESFIGAVLVKAGLVGENETVWRSYMMAIHQVNSLLLTVFVFLFYKSLYGFEFHWGDKSRLIKIVAGLLAVVVTGAMAALAGTLYPEESLSAGLLADFAKESHHLVKLRISHPVLATIFATSFSVYSFIKSASFEVSYPDKARSWSLLGMGLLVAMAIGYMTLFTLSPTPLKIIHLTVAHILAILIANTFLKGTKSLFTP